MSINFDTFHKDSIPTVGTPCTICYISDSYPAVVVGTKGTKTLLVQYMDYKVVSGSAQNDTAQYEYFTNPKNSISEWTLRKNGRWIRKGESAKSGTILSIGHARRRYDPHF